MHPTPDLVTRDLAVFWHPCSQMRDYASFPPLPIAEAQGSRLHLEDGRKVLDGISSWWCRSLGHRHPRITAALHAQVDCVEHVIAANTTHAGLVRCCERLLAAAAGLPATAWGPDAAPGRQPGPWGKVFLADNGSTAVEIALKLALQVQALRGRCQRTAFACLEGGYHGETVAALAVGDCDLYSAPYRPLMFPALRLTGLPLRQGTADPAWQDAAAEWPAIERQLASQSERLAAIIYEPVVQGAGGMRVLSPDLLRRLRAWADAHCVLLIADEVFSGFGRTGTLLASHHAGALGLPHLLVLSKGLTGGALPLSAVLVGDDIYDAFLGDWREYRAFLHSNTWCGNPLALAAANAVLDAFACDDVLEQAQRGGVRLRRRLAAVIARRGDLGPVRGVGMMAATELLGRDPAERTGWRIYQAAVARGALLRPLGDTLYLCPPLNTPPAELDELVDILAAAISDVSG
jgi:adenosylmethionine-8-amino-7-oxononanoate aminotransferase